MTALKQLFQQNKTKKKKPNCFSRCGENTAFSAQSVCSRFGSVLRAAQEDEHDLSLMNDCLALQKAAVCFSHSLHIVTALRSRFTTKHSFLGFFCHFCSELMARAACGARRPLQFFSSHSKIYILCTTRPRNAALETVDSSLALA